VLLLLAFGTLGVADAAGALERRLDARPARQLDVAAVQDEVRRLANTTYSGHTVGAVRCPRRVKGRAGTVFACFVDVGAQVVSVGVTELDDRGRVRLDITVAVLTKAQLEQVVAGNATLATTADCGQDTLVVAVPGQKLLCKATFGDGSSQRVELTVRSTAGDVVVTAVS
jgi:uncharacterized protein DUF4333